MMRQIGKLADKPLIVARQVAVIGYLRLGDFGQPWKLPGGSMIPVPAGFGGFELKFAKRAR